MKMESNPTPTIAELWREFSIFEGNDPLYCRKKYASSDEMREFFDGQIARMEDLRAQLIDRCAVVPDVDGFSSIFEIEERNGQWVISASFLDRRGYSSRHPRCDDTNTAKEYATARAFWAWELEQRQRESTATAETTQQQP